MDYFELLQENCPQVKLTGTRYDNQIAIFGHEFQTLIENQKWFMIGTGALGCEYLKGMSEIAQLDCTFGFFEIYIYIYFSFF